MTTANAAPIINLGAFLPTDSTQFEILQAGTEKGTGWVIELAGPGHPQAVAYTNSSNQKSLDRAASLEAQRLNGRKIKPEERDPDEVRADNIAWVCSRVLGWNPVIIPFISETEPTAYSPEVAAKVFGNPKMGWALSQIVEKITDDATFTQRSPKP